MISHQESSLFGTRQPNRAETLIEPHLQILGDDDGPV